ARFLLSDEGGSCMKPRERLIIQGAALLSNAELLAILLSTGTAKQPVTALAAHMLHDHDGLHGLARLEIKDLAGIHGVGISKACRILAAFELGKRLQSADLELPQPLQNSKEVF